MKALLAHPRTREALACVLLCCAVGLLLHSRQLEETQFLHAFSDFSIAALAIWQALPLLRRRTP